MSGRWQRSIPLALLLIGWPLLGINSIYGWVAFTLLGGKLLLSLIHQPAERPAGTTDEDEYVTAVVPVYNEDPVLFERCLRSLLTQTRRLDRIHVVDDGSSGDDAARVAAAVLAEADRLGIDTELTVFEANRGKREAQAAAFQATSQTTVFLTVDSDTVLNDNALEEALKPFADPEVTCATGLVLAFNSEQNLLTRLIHLRYVNAFMWERAAYSKLGAVLCACGSLALYRAEVIHEHLDDFLSQTFLGRPAVFGDDRRLTNYSLLHGRVVLQPTAVARTAVPERMRHFLRQQLRWNKSFIRESLWVVQNMPIRSPAFALTAIELASWIIFTLMLLFTLAVAGTHGGIQVFGTYLLVMALVSYLRSGHYFSAWKEDSHVSVASRIGTFLAAPIYGALHILVLLPLRTVALCTMMSAGWGTRDQVEVRVAEDAIAS